MGGNFSSPFFSANEKSNHNPSRYVILIICSCSNANTCMPAEEIILNDGPDLFNDPLPGSLKNCQDQEIVINLITNVADYRCRFGKWLGCSMIGSKNTGSINGSGFFVCLCLFLFFWLLHVGSFMFQFSNQGLDPCLLQWKRGVLTTALPGKSRLHISERKVSSKENQPSMSSPFHFKLTGFSSFPSGLLSTFHNWFLM